MTPLTQYQDEKRRKPVLWSGPVLAGDRLLVAGTLGELLAALALYRRGHRQARRARPDPARAGDRQPHDLRLDQFGQAHCPPLTTAIASVPRVAIVGRPNVGKSTLFNRLVGRRRAIVDDTPGVTRDVREAPAQLGDLAFTLLDTAGWETTGGEALEARMRRFTERAIEGSDVVLFLIDARAGVLPLDESFAGWLRKRDRQGDPGRQQVRGPRRPAGAWPRRMAWAWASRSRSRPSTAKA